MMKKFFAVAGLVLAGSLAGGILGPAEEAGAVSGSCYFGSTGIYDMKTGTCRTNAQYGEHLINDVLTGRDKYGNGSAIPSSVNSKAAFITFIRDKFNSPYVQDKVGAAFIMQRMLGSRSWPTTASMNDWEARMNQSTVTFQSLTTNVTSSSWYDPNMRNVFFAARPSTPRSVIQIVQNGEVVIEIQRLCANPTMEYYRPLLPTPTPTQWGMSGSSTINRTTATPGQTVIWTHSVRNNGPDTTTQGIRTWSQLSGFSSSGWNGENDVRTATYARNQARTAFNRSSYTVSQSDVGRVLCQQVRWRATAHNNPGMGQGVNRCVTILPAPWSTVGASSRTVNNINTGTAAPGNIIRWTHTLRLQINSNHLPINSYTHATGFSNNDWNGTSNSLNIAAWRPVGLIRTVSPGIASRTQYTVTQNDVGNDLCQRLMWSPSSNIAGSSGASTPACVHVPHNYELTPLMQVNIDAISEDATEVPGLTSSITNTGPTKSKPSNHAVVRFVIRDDGNVDAKLRGGEGINSSSACDVAGKIAGQLGLTLTPTGTNNCTSGLVSKTGEEIHPPGIELFNGSNSLSGVDFNLGDQICYTTIVSAYRWRNNTGVSQNTYKYAQPVCVKVAKKPKIQFWGGDVRAGGNIATSITRSSEGRFYGSWAEYALFSSGTISSSSGAGMSGSDGREERQQILYNKLTFANTPSFGNFGQISESVIPTTFLGSGSSIGSGSFSVSSANSGLYVRSGNLTINGGEIPKGRKIYVRATGNITINGNLTYSSGPYSKNSELPQLVLISTGGNIVIQESVEKVDAWIISQNGYVSTCGAVANTGVAYSSDLNLDRCNRQLRVNGPIMTKKLYLRRTYGGGKENPGLPAEILNLRPDTYLSFYGNTSDYGGIRTTYVRELPPRY